ncbi:MAG: hypothetical protein SGI83_15150 [Bacteroidota bacterium]|nr:hypothetical protein [Bacteroidota bacterium]
MAKKNNTKKKVKNELRTTLHQKLSLALADYKTILQEKKYERSLKRATRLLTSDIIEAIDKEAKQAAKKNQDQDIEEKV